MKLENNEMNKRIDELANNIAIAIIKEDMLGLKSQLENSQDIKSSVGELQDRSAEFYYGYVSAYERLANRMIEKLEQDKLDVVYEKHTEIPSEEFKKEEVHKFLTDLIRESGQIRKPKCKE